MGRADIQRHINRNDASTISVAVSLNDTTSTTVLSANSDRIMVIISNASNKDIWLKLQAASVDNIKKGIHIPAKGYWEMPTDNIYTGEISAISDSGTPDVYPTEY